MNDKKLKDMWNKAENFHGASGYEKEKIERFITGRSGSVADKIRKMLQFDIAIKSLVALVLVIDFSIYFAIQFNVVLTCVAALAVLSGLIYFEFRMLARFNREADLGNNTKENLSSVLTFLKTRFFSSLLAISSTYIFVFLAGSLVYFYAEYGKLRPLDGTDIMVFLVFIIIGVVLNFTVNFGQVKFHVRHLESCLADFNGGTLEVVSSNIEQQRKKDRAIKLLLALAIVFGFVGLIAVLKNFGM